MIQFNRGIKNSAFINALNVLYDDKSSFWYKLVTDRDLFIAIREEYINVYYQGQSICRLEFKNGIIGHTHKKYLGVNQTGYFSSLNGIISNPESKINSLLELEEIKINVKNHFGKEKVKSYTEVLNCEKYIVDVEASLVMMREPGTTKKSKYKISSIDFVALEFDDKKELKLVFYEAKHFDNSEIRSRTIPKVFGQISRYEDSLKLHKKELINSYKLVIANLSNLHILTHRNFVLKMPVNGIAIDYEPKLIVFDTPTSIVNDPHIIKLRNHFGNRLILKL